MFKILESIMGKTPGDIQARGLGEAEDPIRQAQQGALGYMQPYQQAGTQALGQYQGALGQQADPTAFYDQIMSHYAQSPAAKFQEQQGIGALQNRAAATGMTGSGQEMKDIMKYSQGLASQGQQDYLKNILGIRGDYMSGLKGLGLQGQQAAGTMGGYQFRGGEDLTSLMQQIARAKAASQGTLESGVGKLQQQITGAISGGLGAGGAGSAGMMPI